MRTVYKYALEVDDKTQKVEMPSSASIVHVADQYGRPTLWAEVDTDGSVVTREFRVHGTGHPIDSGWRHVGSTFDGPFVWHVYEYEPF